MTMHVVKWCVDVGLGIVFLFSGLTGVVKFAVLMQVPALANTLLPMALISEIHDRAGIFLIFLVGLHLFLNRGWILSMTQKILSGSLDTP